MYQSKKWILDRRYHTPMVSEHGKDFFVKDFVWAKYECKKVIGYLSSIFTEASLEDSTSLETYAELIVCRLHDKEKLCFTTNTVKVATRDLISLYEGPMNTDAVGWKVTKDSTVVKLSHDKCKSLCEGNILRKNAKGRKVVSVPVVLFSDDVGGSSTHKWNAFSVWCLMLGGLPKKENNDLQNILFLNASNCVSALELSKPLVAELKVLESSGVVMYDASLMEEVLVVSPVFLVKADNKRQSDVVSHLGSCAVKFCQKCTISRVDDDVTTVGDVRSKMYVKEAIDKIQDAEFESAKKIVRARYGVTEVENPMMNLESFDNARSIAYERLHSIELGLVKVVTQLTFCNMSQNGKVTAAAKLEAFDWSAYGRRLSPSFIEKHKSFLGRDFKVFAQVASFIVAESIPREQLNIWHLISKVFNIVHSDKFNLSDAENLKATVNSLLSKLKQTFPEVMRKPKIHMLAHLVEDLNMFGPCDCYDTERCETFMGLVRLKYIFSNHHHPSRDLALSFGKLQQLRFILSGGIWKNGHSYRWCGPAVKKMYRSDVIQNFLNGKSKCALLGPVLKKLTETVLSEKETIGLNRSLRLWNIFDFADVNSDTEMEFYKAIDTTKGIVNASAYLAYHTTDGQISYGKVIQGVRLKRAAGHQDVCQVSQMLPCTPNRYDHFNCSIIKMTDTILFIPIEKIITTKVCIQHCCEYTTCRVVGGKYQHEPLYKYYRVNRFFLSDDLNM